MSLHGIDGFVKTKRGQMRRNLYKLNIYEEIWEHYSKEPLPSKTERSCQVLGIVLGRGRGSGEEK